MKINKKKVDAGIYNKDKDLYSNLVENIYDRYPDGINLPPEYAFFVQNDLLRFLIRLARYKFVARMLKKPDEVLEIGCGSGLGSIFLSQYCSRVVGIDVKTTEIQEAKSLNMRDNVEFRAENLFSLNSSKKWDVIVALDVIEHMPISEGEVFISFVSKLLKKSGMVIIGTPSIYSYQYQGELSKASHVKCYDMQELLNLIDTRFGRTVAFSMNDELVHTGFSKMAWYYFILGFLPGSKSHPPVKK